MLLSGIIFTIVGLLFVLFAIFVNNKINTWLLGIVGVVIYTIGLELCFNFMYTKHTAINCLEGYNPYKQQIIYELKDSIQVPVDTIYVLK